MGEIAIIAFERGLDGARKIQEFLGGEIISYTRDAF